MTDPRLIALQLAGVQKAPSGLSLERAVAASSAQLGPNTWLMLGLTEDLPPWWWDGTRGWWLEGATREQVEGL